MDPLVRTASFRVKPEMLHEAEEVVRQFVAAVKDREPGTRLYVSLQDKDDPTRFLHLMIFEDDCGEDDHSATTWVTDFTDGLAPCLDGGLTMAEFTELASTV